MGNEKNTEKFAYKFFEIYVLVLGVNLKVYLSLQKVRISFSMYEVTMCFLLYNLRYEVSNFAVFNGKYEASKS